MKQNLYAFLQTYMDLNFSFIFLQNLSLFNIYILVFFLGYFILFFFLPKLDFLLIKFTLMLKHISYHLILYPHTHTHTKPTTTTTINV